MDKWYISIQNKARGPFTDLQMKKKIDEGEIEGLTLTYKEGSTDWLPLEKQEIWIETKSENTEIKKKDLNEPEKQTGPVITEWILLVENPDKKGQFLQKGPFTDDDVRELIAKGEVQLKDYCWKPGMKDWKLLFETVELGLSRKPKIEFASPEEVQFVASENSQAQDDEIQQELNLEPLPQLEMELSDSSVQNFETVEDFIEAKPEEKTEADFKLSNVVESDLTTEPKKLSPEEKPKKSKSIFGRLFFTLAVLGFSAGAAYGLFKPAGSGVIPQGLKYDLGSLLPSVDSIKAFFIKPEEPKASYVMIKQLLSNPENILIRSDAKADEIIKVFVLDEKNRKVRLKDGSFKDLEVKTNVFGEAFVDMSAFDIDNSKQYVVSARIGNLKAGKKYSLEPAIKEVDKSVEIEE